MSAENPSRSDKERSIVSAYGGIDNTTERPRGNPQYRFNLWWLGRFILGAMGVIYSGYERLFRKGAHERRR